MGGWDGEFQALQFRIEALEPCTSGSVLDLGGGGGGGVEKKVSGAWAFGLGMTLSSGLGFRV